MSTKISFQKREFNESEIFDIALKIFDEFDTAKYIRYSTLESFFLSNNGYKYFNEFNVESARSDKQKADFLKLINKKLINDDLIHNEGKSNYELFSKMKKEVFDDID
ncbi:3790_t:CDS:2, partial [Acaulospora morrowiae]